MKDSLQKLWHDLNAKKGHNLSMIIGLDGFVDEIVHMVDQRQDFEHFTRIPTLAALGQRISRAAGFSTNIELITQKLKLGGNGPILSNALLSYGVNLTYIGALGENSIHPVFEEMVNNCEKSYSLCDPGHSHALEFDDGKLILGKITVLNKITWDRFKELVGSPKEIAAMIDKSDLFGMENWTMVPYMSQIWQGLIDEVLPLMADRNGSDYGPDHGSDYGSDYGSGNKKILAFFDLADPEKRTKEDILSAMKLIGKFESKFRTVLGLNEKELYEIAEVFDIKTDGLKKKSNDLENTTLKSTTMAVYDKLGIYCLVVHPVKEACCVIAGEYYQVDGPYCEKPKLTTGAGDNFNAGFCLGQALGLDPRNSITLGVCTSGYYVKNAKSPTYQEIMDFVKEWEMQCPVPKR